MANTGTDYGAVLEALNDKADRDMDNLANDGKEVVANLGMPSERYVNLTLPANEGTVIAPADGYIILRMTCSANPGGVSLNIAAIKFMNYIRTYSVNGAIVVWLPVKKNDEVTVAWTNVTFDSKSYFRFIYANGTKHLAPQS